MQPQAFQVQRCAVALVLVEAVLGILLVQPQQIGVATSTATFTRQIGDTIGTAVFPTILFSLAPDRIASAFSRFAPTADFQSALRDPANAAVAEKLAQAQQGKAQEQAMAHSQQAEQQANPVRQMG